MTINKTKKHGGLEARRQRTKEAKKHGDKKLRKQGGMETRR